MKKYIGISLIVLIVAIVIAGGIIFIDSRQYFMEYFEAKRVKLDLRQESSVDSLLQVITSKTILVDSLTTALDNEKRTGNTVNESLRERVMSLEKSVKNLNNVIAHQNKMIDNLKADNSK